MQAQTAERNIFQFEAKVCGIGEFTAAVIGCLQRNGDAEIFTSLNEIELRRNFAAKGGQILPGDLMNFTGGKLHLGTRGFRNEVERLGLFCQLIVIIATAQIEQQLIGIRQDIKDFTDKLSASVGDHDQRAVFFQVT